MTIQLQSANYLKAQSFDCSNLPLLEHCHSSLGYFNIVIIYTEEFVMSKIYRILFIRGFNHNTSLILTKWFLLLKPNFMQSKLLKVDSEHFVSIWQVSKNISAICFGCDHFGDMFSIKNVLYKIEYRQC